MDEDQTKHPPATTTENDEYNATEDFARSIEDAYRVIRERKANGGPGWGEKHGKR